MSGLEIVAGVAAVVSAFNGSVTLYRAWRVKRRERLENAQNQNLERSLTIGGTTVQREYDTHFARLGQQFAVGDDRARAELAAYIIKLQHTIITLMNESNSSITLVMPSLPTMYATSEDTRIGVVSALAEQYQRMSQAKPLHSSRLLAAFTQMRTIKQWRTISDSKAVSENSTTSEHPICEENELHELLQDYESYYRGENGNFRCSGCGFSGSFRQKSSALIRTRKEPTGNWALVEINQRELFKYHFNDTKSRSSAEGALYCPIDYDGSLTSEPLERYTIPQIITHLQDSHTYVELKHRDLVIDTDVIVR